MLVLTAAKGGGALAEAKHGCEDGGVLAKMVQKGDGAVPAAKANGARDGAENGPVNSGLAVVDGIGEDEAIGEAGPDSGSGMVTKPGNWELGILSFAEEMED